MQLLYQHELPVHGEGSDLCYSLTAVCLNHAVYVRVHTLVETADLTARPIKAWKEQSQH